MVERPPKSKKSVRSSDTGKFSQADKSGKKGGTERESTKKKK